MDHSISIQWHITANCQNRCRHCYMFDPATYPGERDNPLTLEEKKAVLDQFDQFGKKWGFRFRHVTLMGGDPLLAPDVFPFMEELRRRDKDVSLGGNPESLTDENLSRLRDLGIKNYQLSLDGLEATHDLTRSPGSFRRTVEGYARLEQYGLRGHTMATLTPLNVDEFFELLDYVFFETRSKGFAFDFVSRVGNGRGLETAFSPEQVLALSNRYLDLKRDYADKRREFTFAEKPGALRLLHMARGEAVTPREGGETLPAAGCLIGRNCVSVLADGTMLSCRRFPEVLGRLPQDSLEDILLGSEILKRYRRPQFWAGCGSCLGWNYCRGCPAVCYGDTGNPFSKPAICYAHLLGIETHHPHDPVPMDTTYEEEAALIKGDWHGRYLQALKDGRLAKVPKLLIALLSHKEQESAFLADPERWLDDNCPELSPEQRRIFLYRYNDTVF